MTCVLVNIRILGITELATASSCPTITQSSCIGDSNDRCIGTGFWASRSIEHGVLKVLYMVISSQKCYLCIKNCSRNFHLTAAGVFITNLDACMNAQRGVRAQGVHTPPPPTKLSWGNYKRKW
jgi:hypothetical protein